ncbi:DUF192 domain-containing protein [Verrucomicrobiota bacterium]
MKTALLKKNNETLIPHVTLALSPLKRMRGLIGKQSLGKDCAVYFPFCNCVHTFFMSFDLDLIFLDKKLIVKKIARGVKRNKMVFGGCSVYGVLEMESGWFSEGLIKEGDSVSLDISEKA